MGGLNIFFKRTKKNTAAVKSKEGVHSSSSLLQKKEDKVFDVVQKLEDLPERFEIVLPEQIDIPVHFSRNGILIKKDEKFYFCVDSMSRAHPSVVNVVSALRAKNIDFEWIYCTPHLIQVLFGLYENKLGDNQYQVVSDIQKLILQIIEKSIEKNASDIHIEVRQDMQMHQGVTEVFFRIYGSRVSMYNFPLDVGYAMASILYDVMADNKSKGIKWQEDRPLDTVIMHKTQNGTPVQIRFASSPIFPSGSFQIVMRILVMDTKSAPPLNALGYTDAQIRAIEEILIGAQGLVLLVGPTNSGKSTSMQAMSKRILDHRGKTIKIETIEDPVEYLIPGAAQMPVSANASFNALLKSTLRHDPDVLIVGEIRDSESAEAVKNIVLAGRKVLATLHVYEALASFSRLIEIGVPRDVLYMQGFISGIIYQRLLPLLCDCAYSWEDAVNNEILPPDLIERVHRTIVASNYPLRVHNLYGCSLCQHKAPGYQGRTLVAEIVVPDARLLDALRMGKQDEVRRIWHELAEPFNEGFGIDALAHAMSLFVRGKVDVRDIEAQIRPISHLQSSRVYPLAEDPLSSMSVPQEDGLLGALYGR